MRIFDIHRLSTHDGPGLRTTIFLKGCSLHCPWCHNPESINASSEPWWYAERCIRCGRCVEVCPSKAITLDDTGVHIDRGLCDRCGVCAQECPAKALEMVAKDISVQDAVGLILRESPFMKNSGGGVTISGGEPLLQAEEVTELAGMLRAQGLHIALDTAASVPAENIRWALPQIDLVLLDLKIADPVQHAVIVGGSRNLVYGNAMLIAEYIRGHGRPELWVRTPIIPGVTDDRENIKEIATFLGDELADVVTRWEILAFNPLGVEKYRRLGIPWKYADTALIEEEKMNTLVEIAAEYSGGKIHVLSTGLTRR